MKKIMALLLALLLMLPAVSSKVFAQTSPGGSNEHDTFTTANSMLICPANIDDTIRYGGCNLKLSIGEPTLSTTTSLPMSEITISNNAPADNIYPVGETVVRWVAKSIYGDSIYCDQIVKVSFQPCPDAVDYEGTIYQSVRLGSGCICWTTTNLRSTKYSDGRAIDNVMDYYSPDYPNTTENVNIFGHLYNWYAAVDTGRYGSVDSVERAYNMGYRIQGVCPDGWYLPSDEEYAELNIYPTTALKSTGYWINGTNNTNSTGFNSLPGGKYSCASGRYENIKGNACYWTCHPVYDKATGAMIDFVCEKIVLSSDSRCNGYSIRCIYERPVKGLPTVTTSAVSNVSSVMATCGGNVTSDGGNSVTARGVCWSTSQNPTVSDSHTTDGSGMGSFTSNITGLTAGTTYYVRAYAINDVGTAYGNEVSFIAQNPPCPGATTVTDYDNNTYNTVKIGNQCWMKENLRTTHYSNGTSIALGSSTSTTTAYRYYPDNNSSNVSTYGYLYNWKAVMGSSSSSSANPSGVQGICPTGWHVPSDAEWTQLTDYVGSQTQYQCDNSSQNIAKALASTTGWNISTEICEVGNNSSSNNATGFSAVPASIYKSTDGSYGTPGATARFWIATEESSWDAYNWYLSSSRADILSSHDIKSHGFSVRCIRD